MAQIRTFICFELADSIKKELAALQSALSAISRSVRWSKPDGIHLTLKFLGDVDESMLDDIDNAVKSAAEGIEPFLIEIAGVGAFPNFKRPAVYWVGIEESSGALLKMQQNIENELQKMGFAKERRTFSPHLTIGRVKSQEGLKEINKTLQQAQLPRMTLIANEIIVMKSVLQPGGAHHTPLSVVKL